MKTCNKKKLAVSAQEKKTEELAKAMQDQKRRIIEWAEIIKRLLLIAKMVVDIIDAF